MQIYEKNGAKYNSIEYVSSNDCSTEMVKQLLHRKGNVAFQHLKMEEQLML